MISVINHFPRDLWRHRYWAETFTKSKIVAVHFYLVKISSFPSRFEFENVSNWAKTVSVTLITLNTRNLSKIWMFISWCVVWTLNFCWKNILFSTQFIFKTVGFLFYFVSFSGRFLSQKPLWTDSTFDQLDFVKIQNFTAIRNCDVIWRYIITYKNQIKQIGMDCQLAKYFLNNLSCKTITGGGCFNALQSEWHHKSPVWIALISVKNLFIFEKQLCNCSKCLKKNLKQQRGFNDPPPASLKDKGPF